MRVIWHIGIMWKFSLVVLLATSGISEDVNNRRSWTVGRADELLPFRPNLQENEAPAPQPNDINLQVPLLPNDGAPPEVPNGSNSQLSPSDSAQNGQPAPAQSSVPQQNGPNPQYFSSNIFPTGYSPPANGLLSQYLPYQYGGLMNSPSSAPTEQRGLNPALANLPPNILSNMLQNYGQYPVQNINTVPFQIHPQNTGPVQNVPPGGPNSFFGAVNFGISPHLNLPTNINCRNTEVLLKVWTIFSNLLDTGGNPVQTPDADQIKFALILIKKYLQEAPQNAANVDIAAKLMELETDLLKNKGVILQDDRPLSSLLTYNPVLGPSVSFKYELPTNMRPACRQAFLRTIETAQEAYRNLAKSPICTGSAEAPQSPNNGYLHPGHQYNLPVDPNNNPYGSASDTQNPQSSYIPPAKSDNALKTILDYLKNHDSRDPKETEMILNSLQTSYPYFPTIDTTKMPPNPSSENHLNFDSPQNGVLTPNELTVNQPQTPLSNPSGFNVGQPQSPFASLPGFNPGYPLSPFANLPGSKVSQPQSPFANLPGPKVSQPQSPFANLPGPKVSQPQSPFVNPLGYNVGQPQSPLTNSPGFNIGQPQSPFANLPGFNVGQPQSPSTNTPDFNIGKPQSPFANLPGFNVGQPQSPFANIPGLNVGQPKSPLTNPLGYNIGQPQSPLTNQPEFNVGQLQPVLTIPLNIGQPQTHLSNPAGLNAGHPLSPLNPAEFDFGPSQSPLSNIPFNIAQLFTNPPVYNVGQTQTPLTNPPAGYSVASPTNSPAFNFDHLPGKSGSPTPQSLFPLGDTDISSLITPNSPSQNDFTSYLKHVKNIADKLNALNPNQNVFRPGTDFKNLPVYFNTNPTYNPLDKSSNMLQNMPIGNDGLNNAYTLHTNPTQSYLLPVSSPDQNSNGMYPEKSFSPDLNSLNPYGTNSPLNSYQKPYQIPFDNTLLTNPNNYQLFPDKVPTNDLNAIANLGKLNPNTKGEIELTYVLKRPKPLVYQPFYYVKYRLPYNNFVKDVGKLMSQNSLRTSKADLYKNLIEMYNASEVPADLAHLPKEQVKDMVLRSGSLVNARLIPTNETEAKGLDVDEKKIDKGNLTKQVTVGLPIKISKAYPGVKNVRVKRNFVTESGLDDNRVEYKPSIYQTGVLSELGSLNIGLERLKRSDFGADPSSTILSHL